MQTLSVGSHNPSTGVVITLSPTGSLGEPTGSTPFAVQYPTGTAVTLTAPSGSITGSATTKFAYWLNGAAFYENFPTISFSASADFSFTAHYSGHPMNDSASSPITLSNSDTSGGGAITASNYGAVGESSELTNNDATVWYFWTSPSGSWYTFDTLGDIARNNGLFPTDLRIFTSNSDRNSEVEYFSGSHGGLLKNVRWGSELTFKAIQGGTYFIRLDTGQRGRTGNCILRWKKFGHTEFGPFGPCRPSASFGEGLNYITSFQLDPTGSVNKTIVLGSFGPGFYVIRYCGGTLQTGVGSGKRFWTTYYPSFGPMSGFIYVKTCKLPYGLTFCSPISNLLIEPCLNQWAKAPSDGWHTEADAEKGDYSMATAALSGDISMSIDNIGGFTSGSTGAPVFAVFKVNPEFEGRIVAASWAGQSGGIHNCSATFGVKNKTAHVLPISYVSMSNTNGVSDSSALGLTQMVPGMNNLSFNFKANLASYPDLNVTLSFGSRMAPGCNPNEEGYVYTTMPFNLSPIVSVTNFTVDTSRACSSGGNYKPLMVTISNTGFAPTSNLVATLTVQNATMVSGSANCTLVSQHRKVVGALQPDASLNYTASAIKAPPIGQTFNATFTLTLVDDAAIYPTYVATRTVLP